MSSTEIHRIQNKFRRLVSASHIKKRRQKRMLRYKTKKWGNQFMNKASNEIFLGASDIHDMLVSKIAFNREEQNKETTFNEFGIYCTKNEWNKYISKIENLRMMQCNGSYGYFFDDASDNYIRYDLHSTHISITVAGDKSFCQNYKNFFAKDFEFVTNQIEWIYSTDGQSIEIPLQHDRMPVEEMYPFLNGQSLKDYYNNYMMSSASILLLIGPPGTGKTTFIRGLLQETDSSAMVSYDANVLEKDYVFASFIEGDKSVMVLEDADMFLKSRREGNSMMHKFLNVGDGLVTTRNKKLIFSTNLPSIRDIDPALVRRGRCYDILHFKELKQEEAEKLAERMNINLTEKREKWTISDIFHGKNTAPPGQENRSIERKFGFV